MLFKFLIKNYYLPFKKEKKNYEKQDKPLQATHFDDDERIGASAMNRGCRVLQTSGLQVENPQHRLGIRFFFFFFFFSE